LNRAGFGRMVDDPATGATPDDDFLVFVARRRV
jgi:hypothetical protein